MDYPSGKPLTINGIRYGSRTEACKAHNINYSTFNSLLNEGRTVEDIFANPPNKLKLKTWSIDEVNLLRKYASTKTTEEIGMMLGRSLASVGKKASKLKISLAKSNENHHFTQYSNLHVAMVHCLLDGGYTPTEVADFSDRARDSIKKIKYNLTRRLT